MRHNAVLSTFRRNSGYKQLHRSDGATQRQDTPPSLNRLVRTVTCDEVAGVSSSLGFGG
jgi:hypothetical protein